MYTWGPHRAYELSHSHEPSTCEGMKFNSNYNFYFKVLYRDKKTLIISDCIDLGPYSPTILKNNLGLFLQDLPVGM